MRGYVEATWGQMHFAQEGRKGQAVLLLHETPMSWRVYERVLPLLGRAYRAYAVDTPGYGLSDPPPEPVDIEEYSRAMASFVETLGIGPVAVVGVHTGASIAVSLAHQRPDLVTHVVLSGIPILEDVERREYAASWAPPLQLARDGSHLEWVWRRYQRIWGEETPVELLHLAAVEFIRNRERYSWAYDAAFRYRPDADLQSLGHPVRFITAEHDLLIESDRRTSSQLGAQLIVVPGLRGQLALRVPELFAQAVAEFLE